MNQVVDQRIEQIAETCAELTANERELYLDRECGSDPELRHSVESYLGQATGRYDTEDLANDYENSLPDHYALIEMLGRGGMAEVFLAEDTRLGRKVAIKFLNSEFRKNPERMRRFTQEARAASALNHPNILIIHDIGDNAGVQYIVSEFIDGQTLGSRISRGKLPLSEAVSIAIQIASALSASHQAGIVHRDMKPDNVMIRRDGSVKVLDFGLAKEGTSGAIDSADPNARTLDHLTTSPGLILGTPQYMSPEQARGAILDPRTDIFSLGIIIFEMVTGRRPFAGENTADTIASIVARDPRRLEEYLSDPPPLLNRIVEKSLRKNKKERYATMEHLLSDLRDLQKELADQTFSDARETGGTKARRTLDHPISTILSSQIIRSKGMAFLPLLAIAAGFAVWWWTSGGNWWKSGQKAPLRSVPITTWNSGARELVAAASFSPDAKMIAFAAARSDSAEIYVKPTDGGDQIQITRNGFYNQFPVWSPNGRDIAYVSVRGQNRGIWRTAFTGGEQFEIVNGLSGGARILRWGTSGKIFVQERDEVFGYDEQSGEKTQLTNFKSKGLQPRIIAIADDGKSVAYSILENEQWKLKAGPVDGSDAREYGSSKFQIDNIAWRPDGETVVYSTQVDGTYQIFESSGGEPLQLSNGNTDMYVKDVSADGSKILYGSISETSDLWQYDIGGTNESVVANDVSAEYWPDFSPDGKSMVYQSTALVDRPFSGSIVVKAHSGPPVVVSQSGFSPAWSHDGSSVAFFKRVENEISIWRVGAAGDGAVKIADGTIFTPSYYATPYLKIGINHFNWSPNDKFVAYSAKTTGPWNIWLANSDGSGSRPLTINSNSKETYVSPTWLPDGKSMVFVSQAQAEGTPRKTMYRLWHVTLENSEQQMIYESQVSFELLGLGDSGSSAIIVQSAPANDPASKLSSTELYSLSLRSGINTKIGEFKNAVLNNISLSRDGRSIAFVTRTENETALWTAPVMGGSPHKLIAENDPKIMFSSISWSADGKSIAYGRQTRTDQISMLSK